MFMKYRINVDFFQVTQFHFFKMFSKCACKIHIQKGFRKLIVASYDVKTTCSWIVHVRELYSFILAFRVNLCLWYQKA